MLCYTIANTRAAWRTDNWCIRGIKHLELRHLSGPKAGTTAYVCYPVSCCHSCETQHWNLCPILLYPCPTLPYPVLSYPILPYTTLPHPTLSYPILPYPTLPYPTLPYPTITWPSKELTYLKKQSKIQPSKTHTHTQARTRKHAHYTIIFILSTTIRVDGISLQKLINISKKNLVRRCGKKLVQCRHRGTCIGMV